MYYVPVVIGDCCSGQNRMHKEAFYRKESLSNKCFCQDFKRAGISRLKGKGQGAVLVKKGQFASYKEKLEKRTEFHSF
jgi:hypothetical protein